MAESVNKEEALMMMARHVSHADNEENNRYGDGDNEDENRYLRQIMEWEGISSAWSDKWNRHTSGGWSTLKPLVVNARNTLKRCSYDYRVKVVGYMIRMSEVSYEDSSSYDADGTSDREWENLTSWAKGFGVAMDDIKSAHHKVKPYKPGLVNMLSRFLN